MSFDISLIIDNTKEIREFIEKSGGFAPLVMIAIQAIQIVIAPFPGELTGILSGYLFGTVRGFIYSSIGLSIGSLISFSISRQLRPMFIKILKKSSLYKKFEFLVVHQGIFVIIALFLLPGFPKDFLCYLLGITRFPWQVFFLVATFCRMPGTLMLTMQGDKIYKGDYLMVGILFTIISLIVFIIWLKRESLYRWMESHSLNQNNSTI